MGPISEIYIRARRRRRNGKGVGAVAMGLLFAATAVQAQSASPSAKAGPDWTLATLMAAQAKRRSGTATFREERHLRSMTEPVVLSGTLSYTAPRRLVKSVTFPHVETLVVDGNRLTVIGADGQQSTSGLVSDHPVLEAAIVSMRAVLVGDLVTLRGRFDARLTGDRRRWTLALKPKAAAVRRKISIVRVGGEGDAPTRFELRETDGDRIVISISPKK